MKVIRNHNHRVFLVKKHPMGKNYLAICLFGFVFSVSYKGRPDWGVLGLSLIPKKACVVSTFRVRNRRDLWKVAAHEFIHTCFEYQHCPDDNPKCLMKDAKGRADFSNKSMLCEKCSKRIYDHF